MSLIVLSALLAFSMAIPSHLAAQNDEYELTATEYYDEALRHLYGLEGYRRNRAEAISLLKKASQRNHSPTLNLLGYLHLEGNGLFSSPRKALRLFERAADLNDIMGQYNTGFAYLTGRGTPEDVARAERYFLMVVDKEASHAIRPEDFGEARRVRASAYFLLGMLYADEDDAPRYDEEKATEMFLASDDLGFPVAAMILAIRYARGDGVEQSQSASEAYLERYRVASLNQLHNDVNRVFFQGMEKENASQAVDEAVRDYDTVISDQIRDLQTSFGAALLDEEELFSPEQAFVWLEPVADKDNPAACARMARLYYRGEGVEKDHAKAREYLELGGSRATLGSYNLATMLLNGEGGEADEERGKELMKKASLDSCYPAHYFLQGMGEATFFTESEALDLVEERSNRNDFQAIYCMGRRYLFGYGVDQDFERAIELIKKAADQDNAMALYFYGVYVANDVRLFWEETEEDKAIRAAADIGYPPAIHHMGLKREQASRMNDALEYYLKAAELEHPASFNRLGELYREGKGIERDLGKALERFQQAADMNHPIGLMNLALAYQNGEGVTRSPEMAYRSYEGAIEEGSIYANYLMGNLLASGSLGEPNWEEAIPYWEKASDQGVKAALLKLGDCYRDGKGVRQDFVSAQGKYNEIVRRSHYADPDANYRLTTLKLIEKSPLYDSKKAVAELRFQEIGGYPLAGYQLGLLNTKGIGVKRNPKKAYAKLLKSARLLGEDLVAGLGSAYSRYYDPTKLLEGSTWIWEHEPDTLREAGADSCYQIALLMLAGEVKKAKSSDALTWLRIAADNGHARAQYELGKLHLEGELIERNEELAWNWILKSSQRLADAQFFVGREFFAGKFTGLEESEVVELLRSAAKQGHLEAKNLLESHGIPLEEEGENLELPEIDFDMQDFDDGVDGPVDLDIASRVGEFEIQIIAV